MNGYAISKPKFRKTLTYLQIKSNTTVGMAISTELIQKSEIILLVSVVF